MEGIEDEVVFHSDKAIEISDYIEELVHYLDFADRRSRKYKEICLEYTRAAEMYNTLVGSKIYKEKYFK